jgi:hypothetical protein
MTSIVSKQKPSNRYEKILDKDDNIKNYTLDKSESALIDALLGNDSDNLSYDGDTTGDIFSVSATDLADFMTDNKIDTQYSDALTILIEDKKEAERNKFLNADEATQTAILLDYDKKYNKNTLSGNEKDILGFITKWGFTEKQATLNTIHDNTKYSFPNKDNYDTEKNILDKTGFLSDGSINSGEVMSLEMQGYLSKKLDLNLEYPEHKIYVQNIQTFLADMIGGKPLSTDDFIRILQNDNGIINADSIQELAKIRGYVAPKAKPDATQTDLDKPEFVSGTINQEISGNCWFLANIGAINNTKAGRDIINNAVEENDDGSYTVKFPLDPKHSYTVTKEEIQSRKSILNWKNDSTEYVGSEYQDKTLTVLNIAAEKLMQDNHVEWREDSKGLYAGWVEDTEELFGLKQNISLNTKDELIKYAQKNTDNLNITFSAKMAKNHGIDLVNGAKGGHAFYIESIDCTNEIVTYIDPYDSDIKRTISIDDFLRLTDNIVALNIPKSSSSKGDNDKNDDTNDIGFSIYDKGNINPSLDAFKEVNGLFEYESDTEKNQNIDKDVKELCNGIVDYVAQESLTEQERGNYLNTIIEHVVGKFRDSSENGWNLKKYLDTLSDTLKSIFNDKRDAMNVSFGNGFMPTIDTKEEVFETITNGVTEIVNDVFDWFTDTPGITEEQMNDDGTGRDNVDDSMQF